MSMLLAELILLWLPIKSLVRFQSVSKSWRALINHPYFIIAHLQHSDAENRSEDILVAGRGFSNAIRLVNLTKEGRFDMVTEVYQASSIPTCPGLISNPCNGLFCTLNLEDRLVIWNPSIKKHKMITPVELGASDIRKRETNVAIGYDLVNNDYKVVKIVQLEGPIVAFDVLVYSLRNNSWRRLEDEWPFKDSFISWVGDFPLFYEWSGTYLKGNIHWLVKVRTNEMPNIRTVLLVFNLSVEKFQVHPFPMESLLMPSLRVLGGNLCAFTTHSAWMMKEYGVASSWSLLYSLPPSPLRFRPLVISQDGQEILIKEEWREYFWYDREKKTRRITKVLDDRIDYWEVLSQGSLVLIDGDKDY